MSGTINDKLSDSFNAADPNVAKVTATRSAGGSVLTCDNLAGWPVSSVSKVHFVTYKLDTNSAVIANSQTDWEGLVTSSTTIGSLTRTAGAADSGNAIGDYVEMMPTAQWGHELFQALTNGHQQLDGAHNFTQVIDSSGNETLKLAGTGSAVNEITLTNAATGNGPTISSTGGDSNVDINFSPKGGGKLKGVVNNLYNPYKFSVYRGAAATTGNGAFALLTFDTKFFDTGSNYSTSTGLFTAPVAGFYHFDTTIGVSGATTFAISIYKNAAEYSRLGEVATTISNNFLSGSIVMQLAANDTIAIYTFGSPQAAINLAGGLGGVSFSGCLVSAT